MNSKILASVTFCAAIAMTVYLLLFSGNEVDSGDKPFSKSNVGNIKTSKEDKPRSTQRKVIADDVNHKLDHGHDHSHAGHDHHHGFTHEATAPKPVDHYVFPQDFENAMVNDAGSRERYFLADRDVFSSLRHAAVNEEVAVELADGVSLKGMLRAIKTYPQDESLLKGTIELSDPKGEVFFFQSSEGLRSHIVFNEKSIALIYKDREGGPSFVQTQTSSIFGSPEGSIYPLNHPSNGQPLTQVNQ